ncbi:MAG: nucleoside transporter C-terminal domain-containing protein [Phycisphaerae bacterium]|nr:nucleoside transporter C-terminal domain-containing protein [Phycisphaerae bacterium]
MPLPTILRGAIGLAALVFLAWLLSSNRRAFPWRTVLSGVALQFGLALLILRTDAGARVMETIGSGVAIVNLATKEGTRFILGELVEPRPDAWGFIFAFIVIPPIIVFSALSTIGYHLGILQVVVGFMGRVMVRVMRVSGAEALSAAANVFVGQTEAPLFVRPYIATMTRSELMAIMVGGFATIASGIMAAYITMLGGNELATQSLVAKHFLTACLMSAPASLVISKIMIPETERPETMGDATIRVPHSTQNIVHAAAVGASDGAKLAFNVCAMLLAFIALIKLLDWGLAWLGSLAWLNVMCGWVGMAPVDAATVARFYADLGMERLDLANLLGLIFSPIAWLIGATWEDCRKLGSLLGLAMSANEFYAYTRLAELKASGAVSERTILLATYSLCGFANFSSIAIQIGGIGAMAPERRGELARLGPRAMLAGAIACWMTATIAGVLIA